MLREKEGPVRYYKFLEAEGADPISEVQWALPSKDADGAWIPGGWMPALEGKPGPKNGYHIRNINDLMNWWGDALYEVEVDGKVDSRYSVTTSPCRLVRRIEAWNERVEHHLICDFAEQVLPAFEARYPGDNRPRQCIETHRRYADGEATLGEYKTSRNVWQAMIKAAWDTADAFTKNIDTQWQLEHLLETLGLSGDNGPC